jgi:hypothetical protein
MQEMDILTQVTTAAGREKFICRIEVLRWGFHSFMVACSHAGVPCSFISSRSRDVPRGCALPLAFPFTPTPSAEHGLIDVLYRGHLFLKPLRSRRIGHAPQSCAISKASSRAFPFFLIYPPLCEFGSGVGVVGPIWSRYWLAAPGTEFLVSCSVFRIALISNRYEKQSARVHISSSFDLKILVLYLTTFPALQSLGRNC